MQISKERELSRTIGLWGQVLSSNSCWGSSWHNRGTRMKCRGGNRDAGKVWLGGWGRGGGNTKDPQQLKSPREATKPQNRAEVPRQQELSGPFPSLPALRAFLPSLRHSFPVILTSSLQGPHPMARGRIHRLRSGALGTLFSRPAFCISGRSAWSRDHHRRPWGGLQPARGAGRRRELLLSCASGPQCRGRPEMLLPHIWCPPPSPEGVHTQALPRNTAQPEPECGEERAGGSAAAVLAL